MEPTSTTPPPKNKVHRVLAHSYTVYFVLFLIGVSLDIVFQYKIFANPIFLLLGMFSSSFGTILIFWAQNTSRRMQKENLSKETFLRGPYKYTRGPTHLGLFFLILGFSLATDTIFVFVFAFLALVITKFTFLDKQEKILEEKYGSHYTEYKKTVKF